MSLGKQANDRVGFVDTPTLYIDLAVWQKLNSYIQACPIEVSGFGYITRIGSTEFRLDDVIILRQHATAASVTIEADTIHSHMSRMLREGVPTAAMRLQWHSHVGFAAYFSSVDTHNIEQYANGWMLSLVINKLGEYEARLDAFEPFRVYSPVDVRIRLPENNQALVRAAAEIRDMVTNDDALIFRKVGRDTSGSVATTLPAEDVTV